MKAILFAALTLMLTACTWEDVKNKANEVKDKMEQAGKEQCEGYIAMDACMLDTKCAWAGDKCKAK